MSFAKHVIITIISIWLVASLAACKLPVPDPVHVPPEDYEVDPIFREFYEDMGGKGVLGPAISPLFEYNNLLYQYTVASLLVYDPQAPQSFQRHLAPLGLDLGITEPPVLRPEASDIRYVDGHLIYDKFISTYDHLGGARYVGRPITEVHYNPDKRRIEQHFENLGFYLLEDDQDQVVRMLAYGVWKCDASCRHSAPIDSTVYKPPPIADVFLDAVYRLGPEFTGYALTEAYPTPDGYIEQAFENVVLLSPPDHPSRVFLRAITEIMGILPDPPVAPSIDIDTSFFRMQADGKGYNVPRYFLDYMAAHGGQEIMGDPIGELDRFKDDIYRQCFKNLCLEEDRSKKGQLRIRPAQLGYSYIKFPVQPVVITDLPTQPKTVGPLDEETPQTHSQPELPQVPQPTEATPQDHPEAYNLFTTGGQAFQQIQIQVWESYPRVSPEQRQEISMSIFDNNVPLSGIEPDLEITLQDGRKKKYYMYPTGEDGQTRMMLEPIAAPSGTLIPYQVCVYFPGGNNYCVKDSFLIWQN